PIFGGPDEFVKGKPGFIQGDWIWDGGWNVHHFVTIHYPKGNCVLTLRSVPGSPPGKRNGGCFAPTTLIRMADGKDRPITELQVGEKVFNPVLGKGVTIHKIVKGPEANPLLEI